MGVLSKKDGEQQEAADVVGLNFKPLGAVLRNVRCMACGKWGHSRGDRECEVSGWNPFVSNAPARLKDTPPVTKSSEPIEDEFSRNAKADRRYKKESKRRRKEDRYRNKKSKSKRRRRERPPSYSSDLDSTEDDRHREGYGSKSRKRKHRRRSCSRSRS